MRQLAARVVWSAVIAAVCVIAAFIVAIVYGDSEWTVVVALVGGGVAFAVLSTRP